MTTLYLPLRSLRDFLPVRSGGLCVLCDFDCFFYHKEHKAGAKSTKIYTQFI